MGSEPPRGALLGVAPLGGAPPGGEGLGEGIGADIKALFGCSLIHFNPHVLVWIGVELELNYTPIHPNTCGLR